jgi:hypothetical protein
LLPERPRRPPRPDRPSLRVLTEPCVNPRAGRERDPETGRIRTR